MMSTGNTFPKRIQQTDFKFKVFGSKLLNFLSKVIQYK